MYICIYAEGKPVVEKASTCHFLRLSPGSSPSSDVHSRRAWDSTPPPASHPLLTHAYTHGYSLPYLNIAAYDDTLLFCGFLLRSHRVCTHPFALISPIHFTCILYVTYHIRALSSSLSFSRRSSHTSPLSSFQDYWSHTHTHTRYI